jgi:V/A-type H+-transporting ATPase subunit E
MELQLQELLDRIRREGVEAAKADAERILADAGVRAKAIVDDADREAKAIVARAKSEATRTEESGRAALEQASRNLLLAFRDGLQALLDATIRADVRSAYGPEVVAEVSPSVLAALAQGGAEDLAVILPPASLKKLEDRFGTALAAQLTKGIEIRSSDQIDAGFRVTEKGGAAYYDFSAQAVADILARHLNTRLAQILKSAAQGM